MTLNTLLYLPSPLHPNSTELLALPPNASSHFTPLCFCTGLLSPLPRNPLFPLHLAYKTRCPLLSPCLWFPSPPTHRNKYSTPQMFAEWKQLLGSDISQARAFQSFSPSIKKVKRKWDSRTWRCDSLELALSKQDISRVLFLHLIQKFILCRLYDISLFS